MLTLAAVCMLADRHVAVPYDSLAVERLQVSEGTLWTSSHLGASNVTSVQQPLHTCLAAGTQGALQRCCEEVLRVLRANMQSLLTIVQVIFPARQADD